MSTYQPLAAEVLPPRHLSSDAPTPTDDDIFDELPESTPRRSLSYANGTSRSGHTPKVSLDYSSDVRTRSRLWWRHAIIDSIFIATWFVFATFLSLYNKWMFSPAKFGFPAPMFVTMMHMFVQWGLAGVLRTIRPDVFKSARRPERDDYIKRAAPTAFSTALDIGLSNLSLKTVTLSFYTMCKSSSLIFVLLFAFLFKLEHFSYRLISVIALIFTGVVLMVASETAFSLLGMILVLLASGAGGLRWALTQLLLVGPSGKRMGMDTPASSVFWLAPAMAASLAVLSVIIESWTDLFWGSGARFWDGFGATLTTLMYVVSPGVLAFIMVMSEFYIIQRVGMVPMAVSGIFKEVTTISLSAWVFGDEITPVNMVGVGITFIGIGLFTHHKYQKTVHSSVPLDAHGNPIVPSDETGNDGEAGVALVGGEYGEVGRMEVFDAGDVEGRRSG